VLAVRRDPAAPLPEDLRAERVYGMDGLTEALGQADFVIIACPLTAETYRLFGEEELRAMKPSAYLINIARAAIVDEQAVHRALTEKWIRGFASDVWWLYGYRGSDDPAAGLVNLFGYHYALPSRLGVHKLPNVIATGDRASFARETLENFILDALDNIRMLARGQRPRNLVDIKRRY
jgi:lactate dehydrogenase-like 2-hydroxyacid dehydrogenase